jgi:pullulanase/glycogen debranching enzyme
MRHQNAFIKTHSPQQVRAVVEEAQRLGYTLLYPVNYKEVVSVVFRSDGTYQLKRYHTFSSDDLFNKLGYREIKRTRYIRRDLCGKTYSQDGQAVLDVVEKSYVPETVDVQPLKWVKPNAYNPIVSWVAEKFINAYAVVRKVVSKFIKHIK